MKRIFSIILCLVLLSGCSAVNSLKSKQYTATFIDLFDTVTTIIGNAENEAAFKATVQPIHDELAYYHKLFDIYAEYDGIINLKTINDNAHKAPIKVEAAIIELLEECKAYYEASDGAFNYAFGSVLMLWHNAREESLNNPLEAYIPSNAQLSAAAEHISPDDIILDTENSTVFFADKQLRLDVGAIAKGWAVQKVCSAAPEGLLLSVGGNIYATGPKTASGLPWAVGIRNPENEENYLHTLNITSGSVVTSGSYIRAYNVDGQQYHHIIDPTTLFPADKWISVTVVCEDSGVADFLSTTLFLLDKENGQQLLNKFNAEALWVDANGNKFYSTAFKQFMRN